MKLQGLNKLRAHYGETLKSRSVTLIALTRQVVTDRSALVHRNEEILDIFHTILGGARQLGFKHLDRTISTIERRVRVHLQGRSQDILGLDTTLSEFGQDAADAIQQFLETDSHHRDNYGLDKPFENNEEQAKSARIMIIEDDSMMRNLIRSVLSYDGYTQIQTVSNAPEALAIAQSNPPEIVVCDWKCQT